MEDRYAARFVRVWHLRGSRGWLFVSAAAFCFAACQALGQRAEPKVAVTGGSTPDGQQYSWTVTNHHSSPIVYIEFPHRMADMFTAPAGWLDSSTNIVGRPNLGAAPPVCRAKAETEASGIQPGQAETFQIRIASAGIKRGRGEMLFRFADGSEETVAGVELPRGDTFLEKHLLKIGFGIMFALFIGVQIVRSRRRAAHKEVPGPS